MQTVLREIQDWYAGQCDGDWEHSYGIRLETLDNPGWRMTIDLRRTDCEIESTPKQAIDRSDRDWLHWWVRDGKFVATCGPNNLEEAMRMFLAFATKNGSTQLYVAH